MFRSSLNRLPQACDKQPMYRYASFGRSALASFFTSSLLVLASTLVLSSASFGQSGPDASETDNLDISEINPAKETLDPETEIGGLALKELRSFVTALGHIRNAYVEEVDDKTLLQNAIKGMLSELDPHSNYLEPQSFEDLQVSANGAFGGLGLEVGMEDGFVKVIAPIDDTPAQKAGIESGDLIIKIDNQPVKGLSLGEAVKMMRGLKGSPIDLTIARQGVPQPIELTLIRDEIAVVSVRSRIIDDNFAYLRIAQFQANTGSDLKKELAKLESKNDLKGIVLDLRNNPGGVLQAAVEVTDTFIDEGLIVYTEGRIRESASRFKAVPGDDTTNLPLIVLINGGSASASEIVAGALQDHKRAIILGTTSFGKGSVQTVIQLSESHGMKLTTARYFTPSGRSIQAQGIVPDIIVERAKITKIKPGSQISEADLHGHLENGNAASSKSSRSKSNSIDKDDEELVTNDNQLYEALTLLKGLNILSAHKQYQAVKKP